MTDEERERIRQIEIGAKEQVLRELEEALR